MGTGLAAIAVQLGNTPIISLSARSSHHRVAKDTDITQGDGEDEHQTEVRNMELGTIGGHPHSLGGPQVPPAAEPAHGCNIHPSRRFANEHWTSEPEPSTSIMAADTVEGDLVHSRWGRVQHRILVVLMSPNITSVMVGIAIAMFSLVQQQLFHNPLAVLRPLGAAIEVRSCSSVFAPPPPFWKGCVISGQIS